MTGYVWLSNSDIFGAIATPPDASDLNSSLCRCRTSSRTHARVGRWSGDGCIDAERMGKVRERDKNRKKPPPAPRISLVVLSF